MRELNPRAWSVDGECWCTRVDYDGYKKEWSGIAPVLAPDNRSKRIGEIEDTNIIVEFPTGLKDRDGKEIYEGDILREKGLLSLTCVEWDKNNARYITKVLDKSKCVLTTLYFDVIDALECEVVGNIHENPELLEEEK